jgi:hypothetical protein
MQFELVTTYRDGHHIASIMTAQELADMDILALAAQPDVIAVSLAAL